jgi:hypothetical protein
MTIDLTTILSSWPFWTAVTVVAVILILRGPFVALLDRTRRVRLFGTSVDASAQPRQVPQPPDLFPKETERVGPQGDPRTATDELLRNIPRTDYTTLRERQLEDTLRQLGISPDPEQKARALIAVAAVSGVSIEFELLNSVIWGSQIKTLQVVNVAPTKPENLRPFYEQAASVFPEAYKAYTFDQWIDFLLRQGVIEMNQGQAVITLKGRSFLTYLAHEGKSFDRAG